MSDDGYLPGDVERTPYEYAVVFSIRPTELHRGPWTLEDCESWINAGLADGTPSDLFMVARREVGEWSPF